MRGRLFAKACDDMEAENTALLYQCETRLLSRAEAVHRVFQMVVITMTM
jgi:hypothetical protein